MSAMEPSTSTPILPPIYQPLNKGEIRLLTLKPSEDPFATLEGNIYPKALDDKPRFEALSYVWGDPSVTEDMELDGRQVAVTTNLASALRSFRERDRPIVLWVDALCINQSDDSEKSAQIPLMGRIYKEAFLVRAWLGESENDSDHAMDTLNRMAREIKQDGDGEGGRKAESPEASETETSSDTENCFFIGPQKFVTITGEDEIADLIPEMAARVFGPAWLHRMQELQSEDKDESTFYNNRAWDSIRGILYRSYWERVWIYQEVALAENLRIHCGRKVITWEDLRLAALAIDFTGSSGGGLEFHFSPSLWSRLTGGPFNNIISLHHDKRQAARGRRKSIYDCVVSQRALKATNPKDLIYGLLEVSESDIIPDYSKPLNEIYRDFAERWLRHACAAQSPKRPRLDPLIWAGIGKPSIPATSLPSWVPNIQSLLADEYCYKPLFCVGRSVGALSLGNKSMADLIGILGSKSSVAQNRIPSQRLLLRLTTEELF